MAAHGTVLGTLLFPLYINDFSIDETVRMFATVKLEMQRTQ